MRRHATWAALAAGLTLASSAWAQPPAPPPAGPPQLPPEVQERYARIGEELVGLFKDLCLDRFPDDGAINSYMSAKGATALAPEEVKTYLKQDPGHGWRMSTPLGLYVLTIEHSPTRACAVRRMTPIGLSSAKGYLAAITEFGRPRGLTVQPATPQKFPANGIDITAFASVMKNEAGVEAEQMILLLSNYHGRAPREFAEDAKGGVGVEVRLVRQPLLKAP